MNNELKTKINNAFVAGKIDTMTGELQSLCASGVLDRELSEKLRTAKELLMEVTANITFTN